MMGVAAIAGYKYICRLALRMQFYCVLHMAWLDHSVLSYTTMPTAYKCVRNSFIYVHVSIVILVCPTPSGAMCPWLSGLINNLSNIPQGVNYLLGQCLPQYLEQRAEYV